MRYGILGGTFDPPHLGHLALAQEAYARLDLDRVWFAPAAAPPHKQGHTISSAMDRRAMVELAIADDERFGIDTVDLDRPGPAYTVETLRLLRERWGESAWIGFIIGWDMLLSLPTWREPASALALLDALIAARRPGYSEPDDDEEAALAELERRLPGVRARLVILPGPQLAISSSDLRERVARDLPVRYLTPDRVRAYITARALYVRT
ncbi:MAG TPA: nicotinate-nucleotide adenylyltransferase [Ktedonobacterales bacterium]|nr:nicotinate-nucleotide adenylyltransferase [Ktedonobacterales bacterium]